MRVLLADENTRVRWALRIVLREEADLMLVAEVADSESLLAETEELQPDLVVVQWELSGQAGETLIASLRSLAPGIRVIVLSSKPGSRQAALSAGADAFVSKAEGPEQLLTALHELATVRDKGCR